LPLPEFKVGIESFGRAHTGRSAPEWLRATPSGFGRLEPVKTGPLAESVRAPGEARMRPGAGRV
jgi:hypothetical protein